MANKKIRILIPGLIAASAAVTGTLHFLSMILDRTIEYRYEAVHSTKVSKTMQGYKIAFITDTHDLTGARLEAVVEELNTHEVDLLVLGGDLSSEPGASEETIRILSQVKTSDGIYGVDGNHDDPRQLYDSMRNHGMVPLPNTGRYIRENLYLAGVVDFRKRWPNIKKATEEAGEDDFVLLLSHNPDVTMLQDTSKVDLTLCGHTHGGQITFFGLWAPAMTLRRFVTRYGQRFMSGWAKSRDGRPVYVSRGTGCLKHIPRIYARPQVIIFQLHQRR